MINKTRQSEIAPIHTFDNSILKAVLDAMPCAVMIVDGTGKVQQLNNFLEKCLQIQADGFVGKKRGEILSCANLGEHPRKLCGETPHCPHCVVNKAASYAISKGCTYRGEGNFRCVVNGKAHSLLLIVSAAPVVLHDIKYAVVTIENLSEIDRINTVTPPTVISEHIIGQHPSIAELRGLLQEAAQVDLAVLIQGETGTGKELAALTIHQQSSRKDKPLITINCGAIPENLLESELFGHVRGAFTGAVQDKKGRFELANGGTIFLDEIGELSLKMQVKLLRFLQEGTFERVGGTSTFHANVRILSATNRHLEQDVETGSFRIDLFYRLCVVPITLPPLRDRKSDIPLLAEHFLSLYDKKYGKEKRWFRDDTLQILKGYRWPGNIRELQNITHFLLMKCQTRELIPDCLPKHLRSGSKTDQQPFLPLIAEKKHLSHQDIAEALARNNGNKELSAQELGVSRATLYRHINKLSSTPIS